MNKIVRVLLTIAIAVSIMPGCMYYYKYFGKRSETFSAKEIALLEGTTAAIQFDYGYEDFLDVDYMYSLPNGSGAAKNEAKFSKSLEGIDGDTLVAFFEKVWGNHEKAVLQMDYYKDTKDWRNYTYISKYILPGMEEYTTLLEKYVIMKNPSYKAKIEERKKDIRETTIAFLRDKRDMIKFLNREKLIRQRK